MGGEVQLSINRYLQQGLAAAADGAFTDAAAYFQQALTIESDCSDLHYKLGIVQALAKRHAEAVRSFTEAIRLNPQNHNIYNSLGIVFQELNQPQKALRCFRKAVELAPDYADAYNNLGLILKDLNLPSAAESHLRKAIALKSVYPQAYNNLALILANTGRPEEAETLLLQALQYHPAYADAYNSLALVLKDGDRYPEAEDCLLQALALRPDYPEAHYNLGLLFTDTKRFSEAETHLFHALKLKPEFPEAEFALGLLYLLQKQFNKGWPKYEARCHIQKNHFTPKIRRWRGENLAGRRILLFHEQGLGDTLQFSRYAKLISPLAAETVLWVPETLSALYTAWENINICTEQPLLPDQFDFACPLPSLPGILGISEKNLTGQIPYIAASPKLQTKWRCILQAAEKANRRRIGVVWAGNPVHKNDRKRSIPFHVISGLFACNNVNWYSLQIGERAKDITNTPHKIIDFSQALTNFAETAGLLANLDLVITIDSAVAHLAGAMEIPTWLLLSHAPDWRWFPDQNTSLWYPSIRIFRQNKPGEWTSVITAVYCALSEILPPSFSSSACP
jgi:Flp pilus assembly protein TadD